MAIASGTVTLADYALMSNSPLVQAVTYSLILYSNILQDVPLMEKKSLIINGTRFEGNLPTVNWSQLNAEGVTTKGTPTAYAEQAYIIRNYIDVDKFLVEEENAIVDPRSVQSEAYLKALTYDMNYKFFKNDHVTGDVNAPVGIRYRINNGGIFGVRPENIINANALDLTQATLTNGSGGQYNGSKLLELIDQLLWSVDSPDGNGVILYMNEAMMRRFNLAMRSLGTSGGFEIVRDQFDRAVMQYKGAILRDPGYKADQSTRIILGPPQAGITNQFGEDVNGNDTALNTTGNCNTSIYAVNYSTDHFSGWQFNPPNVQDLGLIYNGAIYRTLIDWAIGYNNASTRSIGRIYGLKLA